MYGWNSIALIALPSLLAMVEDLELRIQFRELDNFLLADNSSKVADKAHIFIAIGSRRELMDVKMHADSLGFLRRP
jgi:hypothetical protein